MGPYASGSTEPFTANVIKALIHLKRPRRILELGTYHGLTTYEMREAAPQAAITTVDLHKRWALLPQDVTFVEMDAIKFLKECPRGAFDFVFVDDDHTKEHVAEELDLLLGGVVAPGGLIVGHDVFGAFDLGPLFVERGGFLIELPMLHAAGGLGVIEVPA